MSDELKYDKPEIKVDQLSGETVVTYEGFEWRSIYNPILLDIEDKRYLVLPYNMKKFFPESMTNVLLRWKKV